VDIIRSSTQETGKNSNTKCCENSNGSPDGRIIWKLQPVKVRGLTPEPLFTLPSNVLSPPQPIPALIKEEMRQLEPPSNLEIKSESSYEEEPVEPEEYEKPEEPKETILPTIEGLSSIKEPPEAEVEVGPLQQPEPFNESLTSMFEHPLTHQLKNQVKNRYICTIYIYI